MAILLNHFSIDRLVKIIHDQEGDMRLWSLSNNPQVKIIQDELRKLHEIIAAEITGRQT